MEKHAENLGKLVADLQSLEIILRAFLVEDEICSGRSSSRLPDMDNLHEGDIVPLNAFTNYDTLGELIGKYNGHHKISSANLTIDETLVVIRDAIAHGRVSGLTPSAPLNLLKFGKPEPNKTVEVEFSATMTKEWFGEQIHRVYDAILRVKEADERLQNGRL